MTSRSPHPLTGLNSLQRDVLRTLLYFDIFGHPLTADEIYRFLPSNSTSPASVGEACRSGSLTRIVREEDGFFFLSETSPVAQRRANELRARRYMRVARFMGGLIRRFPFVRGVGISGELSKGVVSPLGDIDFFIVTAPERLWIARTLLILFKKIFLLNRKKFFCLNHFVAENFFLVNDHNRYTALEIVTLQPLSNKSFFGRYLASNSWITSYFPNIPLPQEKEADTARGFLQRILEWPLKGAVGAAVDRRLMNFWQSVWRKRYKHLPADTRDRLFQSDRSVSTAYAGDFLTRILREYTLRLEKYGIIPDEGDRL